MRIPGDGVGDLWPGGVPSRAELPAPVGTNMVKVLGHNMDATANLVMIRKGTMSNSRGCEDCVDTITFRTKNFCVFASVLNLRLVVFDFGDHLNPGVSL